MGSWADAATHQIVTALKAAADTDAAVGMAAYMRDQFPFLGVTAPLRDAAWDEVRRGCDALYGRPAADEVLRFAEAMWACPEREYRYVGAKSLARSAKLLGAVHLDRVRALIVTDAWWDTVDILAPNVVGPISRSEPEAVVPVLDEWLVDDDHWLVRSAILHQLKAGADTDRDRLARYCRTAAPHPEFFVRKAVGWALRQYSYIDPAWVEAFVAQHEVSLSGLSRREAMKAMNRDRARASDR